MSQFSVGGRASIAGTTVRAIFSLFASASFGARVRAISITNTTAVAACFALQKFSAATNVGSGLTENAHDINPPQCTAFAGHTGDGTLTGSPFRQISLGAAIGSNYTWVFGGAGILIPIGTANGIGVIVPTGTGQVCDFDIEWEE